MTNPHADRDLHRRVDALCRRILEEEPGIGKEELHERCTAEFSHLSDLTTRQFYARHPLHVKRWMAREGEARAAEEEMERKIETEPAQEDDFECPWPESEAGKPAQREMF